MTDLRQEIAQTIKALGWRAREDSSAVANAILPLVTALIESARIKAAEEMRERAAKVVEEGQETNSSTTNGDRRHLTPRVRGNFAGLAFAEAIRALPLKEE